MSITERTLKKWRGEALKERSEVKRLEIIHDDYRPAIERINRILRLTQELLDQHLLRKEVR